MMNRRDFLAGLGAGAMAAAQTKRLNFVLILIDDLGWADLSCQGSKFYRTPNIDRLASQGVRFTNGYAPAPVCSPTRAGIMTGKFPAKTGITNYLPGAHPLPYSKLMPGLCKPHLALEEVTIAEALKPAGYRSAHIGKWHLGPTEEYWPLKQGFDVNVGGSASGMPTSFFWPAWKTNPPIVGRKDGEDLTDRLTAEAVDFIRQSRNQPFFLYLPHYTVHVPIEAKQELVAKYKAKPGDLQNDPVYAAMIETMDESVGRVMRTLEEERLASNTVVIFTSDNGGLSAPEWKLKPVTSNSPLREGKGHLYEGGIREPFIVRWPGVKPRIDHTPVCSVDFMPTFCEAAGVASPAGVDGVSLKNLVTTGQPLAERPLFWHYPHYSNQLGRPAGAVRRGDWKLIEFYEDMHLELYDLRADIGEKNNLATRFPDRAWKMRAELARWRDSVHAVMPPANPQYDPKREGEGYWWKSGSLPK